MKTLKESQTAFEEDLDKSLDIINAQFGPQKEMYYSSKISVHQQKLIASQTANVQSTLSRSFTNLRGNISHDRNRSLVNASDDIQSKATTRSPHQTYSNKQSLILQNQHMFIHRDNINDINDATEPPEVINHQLTLNSFGNGLQDRPYQQ